MTPIEFLAVDQVLRIHQRGIEEHGGSPELRDRNLLESAVAYLFHLCKNHPFVDGNKRVSVATAETFILVNGGKLAATDAELERLTLGVADGSISKSAATAFFEQRVRL